MSDDCKCQDEILVGPQIAPDGSCVCLRHTDEHQVGLGVMRPIEDGKPVLNGEVVSLQRIEGDRYAVTTLYHAGPSKVSTPAYRDGWDRIFGKEQEVGQA